MSTDEHVTAQRVAGAQRCLCGTADNQCPDSAVVHVLQVDGHPTMSCTVHAGWWARHPYLDTHPIGGACGLPGTSWAWSWGAPPGRCHVEGIEPAALAAAVPAPTDTESED